MSRGFASLGYLTRSYPPYTIIYKGDLPDLPDMIADQPLPGKESHITGRTSIRILEPGFVVRHLTHGGALRHLTKSLFLSLGRSFREAEVSSFLIGQNVPTPGIAAVRYTMRGIFYSIEVISHLVPESIDLLTFLETSDGDPSAIFGKAGMLVRDIHRLGVYHPDLHVKNILLDQNMTPWIIDLDNAYRFSTLPYFLKLKNVRRFVHSVKKWENKGRVRLQDGWEQAFIKGYNFS